MKAVHAVGQLDASVALPAAPAYSPSKCQLTIQEAVINLLHVRVVKRPSLTVFESTPKLLASFHRSSIFLFCGRCLWPNGTTEASSAAELCRY